ncbi:MAG TPA: hypothetical protein VMT91_15085 [Anaerolineales bacterium]|nr:hypothetical protein [Anaerolineales bacterium]
MFRRVWDSILKFFREETLEERGERMLPGAVIGVAAGAVYTLTLSTVNVITLPALHLGLDWPRLLANLVIYALVLGLVGALAGWFTDDYMGAIGGGIVTILVYLLYNWIVFRIRGGSTERMVQTFITAIPLLIGAMVLCGIFRFVIARYLRLTQTEPARQRPVRLAGLVAAIIAASLLLGLFSRFDENAQKVILAMDQRLQTASSDPKLAAQFPLAKFPELTSHFGKHFTLYPRPSTEMPNALDVTIRYEDGYALTCLVPTNDPYVQYFAQCFAGNNVVLP